MTLTFTVLTIELINAQSVKAFPGTTNLVEKNNLECGSTVVVGGLVAQKE